MSESFYSFTFFFSIFVKITGGIGGDTIYTCLDFGSALRLLQVSSLLSSSRDQPSSPLYTAQLFKCGLLFCVGIGRICTRAAGENVCARERQRNSSRSHKATGKATKIPALVKS